MQVVPSSERVVWQMQGSIFQGKRGIANAGQYLPGKVRKAWSMQGTIIQGKRGMVIAG